MIYKWNYPWPLELTWLASSMKRKKRSKNHLLSEWGSYLIGCGLIFLWVGMEKRLQGRPVKAQPPDSSVFKQKRQSRKYFDTLFLFFWLGSSHLPFFRMLFTPEKHRVCNSCQGQKEKNAPTAWPCSGLEVCRHMWYELNGSMKLSL